MSKQECHHILNVLDFVEFSREFAAVNVMGTRNVRTPERKERDDEDMVDSNITTEYWNRDHYQRLRLKEIVQILKKSHCTGLHLFTTKSGRLLAKKRFHISHQTSPGKIPLEH